MNTQLVLDVIHQILLIASYETINNYCLTNKRNNLILKDEYFWILKVKKDFNLILTSLTKLKLKGIKLYIQLKIAIDPIKLDEYLEYISSIPKRYIIIRRLNNSLHGHYFIKQDDLCLQKSFEVYTLGDTITLSLNIAMRSWIGLNYQQESIKLLTTNTYLTKELDLLSQYQILLLTRGIDPELAKLIILNRLELLAKTFNDITFYVYLYLHFMLLELDWFTNIYHVELKLEEQSQFFQIENKYLFNIIKNKIALL